MIKEDVVLEAQHIAIINAVLELHHQKQLAPDLINEVSQSVA